MRLLYSFAWWLALPLVLLRLWRRGAREPGYRQHLVERFGFYREPVGAYPWVWLHAVSVGETRAAEPLIDALLAALPGHRILLTHMTPTGRATGAALFGKHGARVRQCYLPYDTGWMTGRFLCHFRPRLGILMETEVWPNLVSQCRTRAVPLALVNARLSARSLAKGQRFAGLMGEAAAGLTAVLAQTEADARRLAQLGARNVHVTGSIKFDITPPPAMLERGAELRARFGARPVLLCASTREGEEEAILDAFAAAGMAQAVLLLVPRHPQRFDEVARMVTARGLGLARRSTLGNGALDGAVHVVLGDSMGEMFAYYAACDVAFIGGSLLPLGGQNLIEACAVGKPVLIGPHTFNFAAVSEDAVVAGAALRVADASAMLEEARRLLDDAAVRDEMGRHAIAFARQHRGATERTMAQLLPLIKAT
ncbi:3-deoxy-D-manno-octulosonic-acid transferase [Noviherbaspirillum humi]|uniref:3-deoxy-D-manno-octulosonic acid transferase n=1 Tax=Noviherbaspirillum humi TaxID=1688639 RepID=A0A239K847_9BURK|nr:lipid IV(A) 3-deoxy-D-manno-octulosonic acid transferase [Noviherbaspirillum humi]SNT13928.1 3-deoxy-D-manno-octulosonic-acid transferase [Noviherbaspirillum humi]